MNNLAMKEIPERERPISEQFRLVSREYVDADAAASLQEELKSTVLARMKSDLIRREGPMADNKAEMLVKCTTEWQEYVEVMCTNRAKASRLKLELEYLKMKDREAERRAWTDRAEIRMSR